MLWYTVHKIQLYCRKIHRCPWEKLSFLWFNNFWLSTATQSTLVWIGRLLNFLIFWFLEFLDHPGGWGVVAGVIVYWCMCYWDSIKWYYRGDSRYIVPSSCEPTYKMEIDLEELMYAYRFSTTKMVPVQYKCSRAAWAHNYAIKGLTLSSRISMSSALSRRVSYLILLYHVWYRN